MKTGLQNNHRIIFYGVWLFLSILQAGLTELLDDEAYYWAYSRFLDWGYFDHPPMTALLIKMGYAVFPNELGVRLLPLLLTLFSLLLIERIIEKKNTFLFYTIVLSITVLQVIGFVAVPDIPLIFFTALFFYSYKKFANHTSLINAAFLGLAIALLLYSKYHAVLIVLFTLLSNVKLLAKYQAWVAALTGFVLFLPHLEWQWQHDWVSFRYHLFESNVNKYKPSYTIEYILGQFLLAGPVAGFLLLPAAFLYKPQNDTEKALRFTMLGIYIFFLLSSFRGRVEANWTSPVLVPLIILSHNYLVQNKKWAGWLRKWLPLSLLLVLFARIIMIVDIVPLKIARQRYHSWKEWPRVLKEKTNGFPLAFSNSYQRTSKYWFYSKVPAYSMNSYKARRNNYNFWPLEDSMLGRPAYFLDKFDMQNMQDSVQAPIGGVGFRYDSAFLSFGKIKITPVTYKKELREDEQQVMQLQFDIPPYYAGYIRNHYGFNDTIRAGIFADTGWIRDAFTPWTLKEMTETGKGTVEFFPAVPKGKYFLRFAINCGYRNATHNSDKIRFEVK